MTALHPGGRIASRASAGAAAGVIAIGVAVLAGWAYDIERFMTVTGGSIRMKPNTALALSAAAIAILLESQNGARWFRRLMASIPLSLGLATLFQYVTGMSLGIDQILFRDPVQHVYPGRMAHLTAANLVLIALALFALTMRPRRMAITQALALTCGVSSLLAIVGYLYGVPILYGSVNYTSMAIHTGISFLLLSLGILFVHPEAGLAARFRSLSIGGDIARRLIPLAIAVPIALGAAFVRPQLNFGEMRLGLALSVMTSVIAIVTLITQLSRSLGDAELARLQAEMHSTTDHLTGIPNRRYFDQRIGEEMDRSSRNATPLSLILLDIDHFKRFNDQHGHATGDAVLQWVASVAARSLRSSSVLCRYGGEEFGIVVTDATLAQAAGVAERVCEAIARSPWPELGLSVTISAGVAEWAAADTQRSLTSRADQALYLAKRNGRNRVESVANRPPALPLHHRAA